MEKPNHSKGKTSPVSLRSHGADTGLGSIFTGSDRVATGAAICSLTFPALSSCRASQAKARWATATSTAKPETGIGPPFHC